VENFSKVTGTFTDKAVSNTQSQDFTYDKGNYYDKTKQTKVNDSVN